MSSEFFTRETWRPSKKGRMRKRTKPWGGRKTAPPGLLEAGKRTQFGSGVHRVCKATKRNGQPCRMIAFAGMDICGAHGGFRSWARQGKLQKTGRTAAFRAAAVEGRTSAPPLELTRLMVYRQANDWTRSRMSRAWQTESWRPLMRQILGIAAYV